MKGMRATLFLAAALAALSGCSKPPPAVTLDRDDAAGTLIIRISGREALVYQYGETLDLPHYWPMRSPSGRNLLVRKTEPYPHHRSFWFADTVRLEGEREASFYNALSSGVETGEGTYGPPFRDRVRHVRFSRLEADGGRAEVEAELVWEMDGERPVLNERRRLAVHALGGGEYLLDLQWTLTAAHGDVHFTSDDVHYAWPYLRMSPSFSGENGGTIVSDTGARGQEATNMEPALWIDYSNTVEGVTEGVAVFQWPDGRDRRWLTREYGTFGPRRPDDSSGRPFTLKRGESISQRVGVLVHRGNAAGGRVRERYDLFLQQVLFLEDGLKNIGKKGVELFGGIVGMRDLDLVRPDTADDRPGLPPEADARVP